MIKPYNTDGTVKTVAPDRGRKSTKTMAASQLIDLAEAKAIAAGTHNDPFSILGGHKKKAGYVVCAFDPGAEMMAALGNSLGTLPGTEIEGLIIQTVDDFSYSDPVDQMVSSNQGIRIIFEGGARIVLRLSGTGTVGATLRVYLERYENNPELLQQDPQLALAPIIRAAEQIAQIQKFTGRNTPDVKT